MSDLLSPLTAERLEELAANERNVADQLEAQADAEGAEEPSSLANMLRAEAAHHRQLAAICEALAGAERAMASNYFLRATAVGVPTQFWCGHHPFGDVPFADRHPTLIAALASVAKQEETNDG